MFHQPSMQLWAFASAPQALKALSTNGGDEDWVMFVPEGLEQDGSYFAMMFQPVNQPAIYYAAEGSVYIWSHA